MTLHWDCCARLRERQWHWKEGEEVGSETNEASVSMGMSMSMTSRRRTCKATGRSLPGLARMQKCSQLHLRCMRVSTGSLNLP